MAPIVWGPRLARFNCGRGSHFRRTKLLIYALAITLCLGSAALSAAALADYSKEQEYNRGTYPYANDYIGDCIGVTSSNIVAGIFVALVYGAAIFFDLRYPKSYEVRGVRNAWKTFAVLSALLVEVSAIALTVTIAQHQSFVKGITAYEASQASKDVADDNSGTPYRPRMNYRALAAVMLIWPGLMSTIASCVLLFFSTNHNKVACSSSSRSFGQEERSGERPMQEGDILDKGKEGHHKRSTESESTPARTSPALAAE